MGTPGAPAGASRRALVVGASSGLGRCIGVGLARRGWRVALLARRADRLAAAAAEAGAGSVAVPCDVRDANACSDAIGEACAALGGADALVYSAGIGPLAPLAETTAAAWRAVFDTNVVGASLATAAALPHLARNRGRAVYLSSMSASMTPPWPGLGAYVVSKAALDKLVDAWRVEHPEVAFTRVALGNSAGGSGPDATDFTSTWDAEQAARLFPEWEARGLWSGLLLDADDVVDAIAALLALRADVPTISLLPPGPVASIDG